MLIRITEWKRTLRRFRCRYKANNIEMYINEIVRETWAGSTGLVIGSNGIILRTQQ
jgi:hypothetical protein